MNKSLNLAGMMAVIVSAYNSADESGQGKDNNTLGLSPETMKLAANDELPVLKGK